MSTEVNEQPSPWALRLVARLKRPGDVDTMPMTDLRVAALSMGVIDFDDAMLLCIGGQGGEVIARPGRRMTQGQKARLRDAVSRALLEGDVPNE